MKKPQKIWVAWFANTTDKRDDEWAVYRNCTQAQAIKQAMNHMDMRGGVDLEGVFPLKSFIRRYGFDPTKPLR